MSDDEDLEISNRTWAKIADNVHKEGFREGASDGHNKSFQKGFDTGYLTGLKNSEKMGFANGIMRAMILLGMKENDSSAELIFENAERGLCVMCPGSGSSQVEPLTKLDVAESFEKYNSKNIEEILEEQEKYFQNVFPKTIETNQPALTGIIDLL